MLKQNIEKKNQLKSEYFERKLFQSDLQRLRIVRSFLLLRQQKKMNNST